MINPHKLIELILSEQGFSNELFAVRFDEFISVKIERTKNGHYQISFLESKPTIKVSRFITLHLKVAGILLKEESGVFQIDYFPDIPFKYDWLFPEEKLK
jgi:hypothetical protein